MREYKECMRETCELLCVYQSIPVYTVKHGYPIISRYINCTKISPEKRTDKETDRDLISG